MAKQLEDGDQLISTSPERRILGYLIEMEYPFIFSYRGINMQLHSGSGQIFSR